MLQNKLFSLLKSFLDPERFAKMILVAALALYFSFGSYHLAKFVTADEHYWIYERIPQYWNALREGKLKNTLINDKPGVTVALISGAGLLFEKNPENHITKIDNNLDRYDTARSERLYFAFRLPILIFNGLFLLFFFWIIKKISNQWVALWSVIFIGLSPVLLGISQIINPDSFLWLFSAAAIFSYLALLKHDKKIFVLFTAIFTGLAILSKYTANVLFPFYILLMVFYYVVEIKGNSKEITFDHFKRNIISYLYIVLGAIATISIFLPAIFIKPIYLYRLTIGFSEIKIFWWIIFGLIGLLSLDTFIFKNFILFNIKRFFTKYTFVLKILPLLLIAIFSTLIIGRNLFPEWQMFKAIPFDVKNISDIKIYNYFPNFSEKILLEFSPVVFSLTPIVLFLSLFAWMRQLTKSSEKYAFYIFSFCLFIIAYFVASIKADTLATIRYSVILYPLICFMASIGLYELADKFPNKMKSWVIISLSVLIISTISLFFAKPYYFNYTNFLLPEDQSITDAWGYGGYEAAERLNTLPGAENLTVWSDYYGVCEFFKGKCLTDYKFDQKKYPIDYYVLTRRGKIRYEPNYARLNVEPNVVNALSYYSQKNPVWELFIDNRQQNYVKIYKSSR
jgi:hypothetical protein